MAEASGLSDIKKEVGKEKSQLSVGDAEKPGDTDAAGSAGSPSDGTVAGGKEKAGAQEDAPSLGAKLGEMAEKLSSSIGDANPGEGKPAEQKAGKPGAQAGQEDMKKQINDIVSKKVSTKMSDLKENMKGLEKIAGLEDKINKMAERLNSQMFQPPQQAQPAQGGGSSISRELASFGEEVDFQTELYEQKKAMAGIAKSLDTLSKKMEYRISILEDRAKTLERIPDLEERLGDIRQKLGPENVQKLRKLIFSSDEIVDEVIPELVNKKIRAKLDPAINEIRDMQETVADFNSRLSHIKEEVLNLEKLRDDIQELRADKENLYKELDEEANRETERLDILKQSVRRKIEGLGDNFKQELRDLRKLQGDHIKTEVNNAFTNLIDPRFTDIEKIQVIIEEKLKRMGQLESKLEKKVDSIEAPENVKKWLDTRIDKIERGLVTDISALQGKSLSNSTDIAKVAQDLKTFKASLAEVPKYLNNQGTMINKLLDSKDYFMRSQEAQASDIRALSDKLAALKASHSALEQRLSSQESIFTDSLNKQRDFFTAAREDLTSHLNREIASIRKGMQKANQEQSKTTLAEFKTEIKRLSSTEEELKAIRKAHDTGMSSLQRQVSDLETGLKAAYPELKINEERVSALEAAFKDISGSLAEASEYHKASDSAVKAQLMKYVDSGMKALQKDMKAGFSDEMKAELRGVYTDIKRIAAAEEAIMVLDKSQKDSGMKLQKQLTELQASMKGAYPELRLLEKRLSGLEGTMKGMSKDMSEIYESNRASDSNIKAQVLKYVDSGMKTLKKDIEERRNADAKAQLREFKEELKRLESIDQELAAFKSSQEKRTDELSQGFAAMSGPVTDLKALNKRVGELEDIIVALDKRQDVDKDRRTGQIHAVENRLNLLMKSVEDLSGSLRGLDERVSSDNERLQKALDSVMADKKALQSEFVAQRTKIGELTRELKNL